MKSMFDKDKRICLVGIGGISMSALAIALARCAEMHLGMLGASKYDTESAFFCRFPFAVSNEWDEWYLAVFALEALTALVICVVFALKRKEEMHRDHIGCVKLFHVRFLLGRYTEANRCGRKILSALSAITHGAAAAGGVPGTATHGIAFHAFFQTVVGNNQAAG